MARILLLDDEQTLLFGFALAPHDVVKATNYDEAVVAAKEALETGKPFDLVITDHNLKDQQSRTGIDFARWLKGEYEAASTKVPPHMLLSTQKLEDLPSADQALYQTHLLKPVDPIMLLGKAVNDFLAQGQMPPLNGVPLPCDFLVHPRGKLINGGFRSNGSEPI